MPAFRKDKEGFISVKDLWLPMCNKEGLTEDDVSIYLMIGYEEGVPIYEKHPLRNIDEIEHWYNHKLIKWKIEDYHMKIWVKG